jgi:hypothetical protein
MKLREEPFEALLQQHAGFAPTLAWLELHPCVTSTSGSQSRTAMRPRAC